MYREATLHARPTCPTQDHIAALASEMGVHAFDQPDTGQQVYYGRAIRLTYSDSTPVLGTAPPDPTIAADVVAVVALLDQMATEISIGRPYDAPQAEEWDGQSFGAAAVPPRSRRPDSSRSTAVRSSHRSDPSIGPVPRRQTIGTDTWTVRAVPGERAAAEILGH